MNNEIKITTIDTRFNEVDISQVYTFKASFLLGRDIPYCIIILSLGKKHKCYSLNEEFNGSGCCISTFEKWLKSKLELFEQELCCEDEL